MMSPSVEGPPVVTSVLVPWRDTQGPFCSGVCPPFQPLPPGVWAPDTCQSSCAFGGSARWNTLRFPASLGSSRACFFDKAWCGAWEAVGTGQLSVTGKHTRPPIPRRICASWELCDFSLLNHLLCPPLPGNVFESQSPAHGFLLFPITWMAYRWIIMGFDISLNRTGLWLFDFMAMFSSGHFRSRDTSYPSLCT